MSKPSNNRPKPKAKQPIDPLLAKRLEQLNTRRPAGAPLPPPAPGTAAGYKGSSASAKQASAKQARPAAAPAGTTPEQAAKLAAAAERAAAARAAKQGGARPGTAVPPSRRNKPAAASKVASVAISAATTLALAGMFARQDGQSGDSVTLTAGTDPALATTPTTAAAAAPATTVTTAAPATDATTATTAAPVTTVAPAPAGIADGTYVGDGSRNRFGTVQVQVVYSGGQLTDVQILSYPDGDRRSIAINQRALPTLIEETIQAQSADIYGVSGATYTSRSYYTSLQSAIDNAKQASGIS